MIALDPANLQVDSFSVETIAPLPGDGTTVPTQRTYERDCTMPGLCPETR
jgi:hypothetical protein